MDARVPRSTSQDITVLARHLANFAPLLLIATTAFWLASTRIPAASSAFAQVAYALIVALNVLVLAMASWSTMLGTMVRLAGRRGTAPPGMQMAQASGRARTAVLIAVHEEDAARVFATARAIADDVASKALGVLDVFVLSDTRSSDACAIEETMLALATRSIGPRLHYRRRARNLGRKAGNVADFVRDWGAAYDFMIVLDADSLMTGDCIARLVGAMEANPSAGLVQAMCYPVGRHTWFARLQQFDSRLLGPLFQGGVAYWQGPCGNYWGHNAIIRIAAFAASCGLPDLPGRPPLGGEILSHDTIEAALMLRGGYDVWLLPDGLDGCPDGSWEETPTNLLDHLERDRRWLRGNLQHGRVLAARGLKPASLYHLVRGLSHFLYAPLLLAWIAAYAILDRCGQVDALVVLVAVLTTMPRILGLAAALFDGEQVAGFGGRGRLVLSALLDQVFIALLYPTVVVSHLVDLGGLVVGGETRWEAQSRSERGLSWREALRTLAPALCGGLVALLVLAPLAPLPAALLAPGLLLGVPLAVASSRRLTLGLFATPEDTYPHPLRAARSSIEAALRAGRSLELGASPLPLPPRRGLHMPVQPLNSYLASTT